MYFPTNLGHATSCKNAYKLVEVWIIPLHNPPRTSCISQGPVCITLWLPKYNQPSCEIILAIRGITNVEFQIGLPQHDPGNQQVPLTRKCPDALQQQLQFVKVAQTCLVWVLDAVCNAQKPSTMRRNLPLYHDLTHFFMCTSERS